MLRACVRFLFPSQNVPFEVSVFSACWAVFKIYIENLQKMQGIPLHGEQNIVQY